MEMFLFLFHFIVSFFASTDGTPTKLSVGLVTESSKLNVDSSGSKAFDGSSTTQWVSGACRTGGWKSNKEINLLTDICANGLCSASCDADKLTSSNDQSVYTAATIPISHSEGRSWVRYDFPSGLVEDITSIYIRGSWAVNTSLFGILSSGELTELIVLNQDSTYQDVNLPGPFPTISGLYLQASSKDGIMTGYCYSGVGDCQTFTVTEIAVQKVPCFEELTVDLGSYRLLSRFSAQYSGFVQGTVSTSIDGLTFLPRITLDPPPAASSQTAEYEFPSQAMGRYLKFRFFTSSLESRVWDRVSVREIVVYGENYPLTSTVFPNNCSDHGFQNVVTGQCECNQGFSGVDCSIPLCDPTCVSGQGKCMGGECICEVGYTGPSCSIPICPFDCWNNGVCLGGQCRCDSRHSGSDCRFDLTPTTVENGKSAKLRTLNRQMMISKMGVAPTRNYAQTDFYKNQLVEESLTPFLCETGGKSVSLGNCSLQQSKHNLPPLSSKWSSAFYDVKPLSVSSITSSSSPATVNKVVDNDLNTFWQSGFCYPTGYLTYADLNILSNLCGTSPSSCQMSSKSTSYSTTSVTDLNTNTGVSIDDVDGLAYFQINFPTSTLQAVSAKVSTTSVSVYGVKSADGSKVLLFQIPTAYSFYNFDFPQSGTLFSAIRFESTSSFTLSEIAARSSPCAESVTLDFGSEKEVTGLSVRHWSGSNTASSVASTLYQGSVDGVAWVSLSTPLSPQLTSQLDVEVSPSRSLRFVRVTHVLNELASAKVMLWEISVWGSSGRYGSVPAEKNAVSFRDLLGVNGIWSWGGQGWSHLALDGWGPHRYSNLASHARNYHNWNWDVKDPDQIPDYEAMSCGSGTPSNWWLSWDWEYRGWNAAGLEVDACIQFTSSSFPQSVFNDPYQAGYNYGYSFAKHFGRLSGTGDISTIEVGNEPWIGGVGYSDPNFYRQILSGMSQGAKEADPTIRVLPAAFGNLNDTLSRVTPDHLRYLDGWNIHTYSWINTVKGRTGIFPEHPLSTLHSVNSMIRFRDANTPNLPIHLTEWGWDSAGGGEDCNPPAERSSDLPFPECVSEDAQALYAVRGALVLARKGLSRLTWFFYGNTEMTPATWDRSKGVFSRSGLTSSSSSGFQNKKALYALEDFISILGDTHFLSVIREDSDAYVYVLGSPEGTPTHVVAWRPVSAEDTSSNEISFSFSDDVIITSWSLIGGTTIDSCSTNPHIQINEGSLFITLSRCPVVLSLSFPESPSSEVTIPPTPSPTN